MHNEPKSHLIMSAEEHKINIWCGLVVSLEGTPLVIVLVVVVVWWVVEVVKGYILDFTLQIGISVY